MLLLTDWSNMVKKNRHHPLRKGLYYWGISHYNVLKQTVRSNVERDMKHNK